MNTLPSVGERVETLLARDDWQPAIVASTQCPEGPEFVRVLVDVAPEFEKFRRPTLCLRAHVRALAQPAADGSTKFATLETRPAHELEAA